ncbi:hypothetical protein E1301_Tti001097 [Triplophysa tibetana]|uniref:Uncharacterized protein n=1 Tax=Triplophysa tibetana TaxID=1572043 RepID=A0A5A9N5V3_9TELE|nr:hypothetical protein E1301_Tti001097 [Triplophysa tibetana]
MPLAQLVDPWRKMAIGSAASETEPQPVLEDSTGEDENLSCQCYSDDVMMYWTLVSVSDSCQNRLISGLNLAESRFGVEGLTCRRDHAENVSSANQAEKRTGRNCELVILEATKLSYSSPERDCTLLLTTLDSPDVISIRT